LYCHGLGICRVSFIKVRVSGTESSLGSTNLPESPIIGIGMHAVLDLSICATETDPNPNLTITLS